MGIVGVRALMGAGRVEWEEVGVMVVARGTQRAMGGEVRD
jgi:hypothetical protein